LQTQSSRLGLSPRCFSWHRNGSVLPRVGTINGNYAIFIEAASTGEAVQVTDYGLSIFARIPGECG
jgi:hypothetical protein